MKVKKNDSARQKGLTRRVTRGYLPIMTTAQDRKKQERQARRRRIQRAAREVFAAKGFTKTSIEQVARQASLSVGAIYLYFRSKEDLYVSLLEETFELFDAELKQINACTDLSFEGRLEAAWSFLSQWAVSDVEGTRTLRLVAKPGVRKQLSDEVAQATKNGITSVRAHFASLIQGGTETGEFSATNANDSADLFWALFIGLLQANDARANLELTGHGFTQSANVAFAALKSSLNTPSVQTSTHEVAA